MIRKRAKRKKSKEFVSIYIVLIIIYHLMWCMRHLPHAPFLRKKAPAACRKMPQCIGQVYCRGCVHKITKKGNNKYGKRAMKNDNVLAPFATGSAADMRSIPAETVSKNKENRDLTGKKRLKRLQRGQVPHFPKQ